MHRWLVRFGIAALLGAATVSQAGAAFFNILPDGRTLHIVGSLTGYDAPIFGDIIEHNGGVDHIVFTSDGGSMGAAMAIGRYIYDHNITTSVQGYCLSACAFIWLAGRKTGLSVEDGALVGIHVPFADTQSNVTLESVAAGAWYLGRIGAPEVLMLDIMNASLPDNGMTDFLPLLAKENIDITVSPKIVASTTAK
jgi:hypothetical protein